MRLSFKYPFMQHKFFIAAILAIALLLSNAAAISAEKAGPPLLSAAETNYPPFSIVKKKGQANGFAVELMRAALNAMDREVTFRTGPWAEVRGWLEHGEVKALPLVGRTPERESIFDFTFPYMSLHGALVVRTEATGIRGIDDLKGKTVAVMKGDNAEEFLRRRDHGVEIRTTSTFKQALKELSEGRYAAVLIPRLVALRLIQENELRNLQVVNKPVEDFRQDFCFAVKAGDRDTLALLNEGLSIVMADGTYRHLHAKWFAALQLPTNRRMVIGGDHNYPPFEYLDENGNPTGFNTAVTKAIAKALGLDIEIRLGPWAKIRDELGAGKIDAIQGMLYSPRRDLTFDFTQPYTVNHYVSVTRKGERPPPETVEALRGQRIVVQKGDIMHDFVLENGLEDQLVTVDAQEDALEKVASGDRDYALVARLTALYWIDKKGWQNLTLSQQPLLSPGYGFAVPHNQKALLSHFSEGLKIIEKSGEYQQIRKKWLGIYEDLPPTFSEVFRHIAWVAVPLILAVLAVFFWSWSLRKQVRRRTAELQNSEEQYRLLADNTLDVIWTMTPETVFTYVNPAIEQLTGHTPGEWIGTPLSDHCSEAEFTRMATIIAQEIEKGRDHQGAVFEAEMLRKDGSAVAVEIHGKVVFDEDSAPVMLQGVTREITERKQAEQALRRSEALLNTAQRITRIGAWEWDVVKQEMFWTNETFLIHGFDVNEIEPGKDYIGRSVACYSEADRQRVLSAFQRCLENGEPYEIECRFITAKGNKLWIRTAGQPVYEDNRIFRVVGYIQDITESKQAEMNRLEMEKSLRESEEKFVQAQKMESVGRLAGGVAHDYNNALSVIIGYTEMALDKVSPDEPLHKDLKEILSAATHSAAITRQLLAFARKQTISPKVIDLNDTIENMLKMLRRLIGEDIDLAWRPGFQLWQVKMDPAQADQILANLCVNAGDAINGVGKITIETQNVTFNEEYCRAHTDFLPGQYVLLAVSDDGCGMDKETLKNIFEPFYTTKGLGEGTGLGLATVYGIVKQNEGFINVYSEPEKGTTFKIYLSRHIGGEREESETGIWAETPVGRGETILLVEDDLSILNLGKMMLEKLGYTVLCAKDPNETIAITETYADEIHLLITDVVMPGMNGRELAQRLETIYPGLKVLYMSGYTANVIAHRGVLESGTYFLQKPFSKRELAVKVREVLLL